MNNYIPVALFMLWPVVFVVVFGTLIIVAAQTFSKARRRELERAAAALRQLGFSVITEIPRPPSFPFREFQRTGGTVTLHITQPGTYDTAFHYSYTIRVNDHNQTVALSCAVVPVEFFGPSVSIWKGSRSILGAVGGNRVDTDSERFNKLFEVECANERFAYTLLSYEVIEWFLSEPAFSSGVTVRIAGNWMLLVRNKVDDHQLPGLLVMAQQLRGVLPDVLTSMYPLPQAAAPG